MTGIRVRQRHSAIGMTEAKRRQAVSLGLEWQRSYGTYLRRFANARFCGRVMRNPRSIREDERRSGWANPGLSAHYNALALEAALRVLRSHWAVTLNKVREAIGQMQGLRDPDRRWMRYVIRWPELLQLCLDGEVPPVAQAWADDVDEARLAALLRTLVLASRPRRPRPSRRRLWFEIDTNTYRTFERGDDRLFRGAWLALTGSQRGQRLCIPLAGRGLSEFASRTATGNSRPRVVVVVGTRLEFLVPLRVDLPLRARSGPRLGIDKGYRTLLTVSDGEHDTARSYGEGASTAIAAAADEWAEKRRNRDRLRAYEVKARATEPTKACRIRKNNLGFAKMDRTVARHRRSMKCAVGQAVNDFFRIESHAATIVVEDLRRRGESLGTTMNRRLGRWLKGYLHKRLSEQAELNGVELIAVNAAYTSQSCPRCGFVSRRNRRADTFRCTSCDFTGLSDAVAATNVLSRGSDSAITLFTSRRLVKKILNERWRSARSDRAWDSNPGPDATLSGLVDEPRTTEQTLGSLTIPRLRDGVASPTSVPAGARKRRQIADASSAPTRLRPSASG